VNQLALFDFDETLTQKDTFRTFMRFAFPADQWRWRWFCSLPDIGVYMLNKNGSRLKTRVLNRFFSDYNKVDLEAKAIEFVNWMEENPSYFKTEVLFNLMKLRDDGAEIAVVSASPELWIEPWCKRKGIRAIATKLEWSSEGKFIGLDGKNCSREEKVVRIQQEFDLSRYKRIVVYGNKGPDDAMLELGTEKHAI